MLSLNGESNSNKLGKLHVYYSPLIVANSEPQQALNINLNGLKNLAKISVKVKTCYARAT
jgi:hypothetical protein